MSYAAAIGAVFFFVTSWFIDPESLADQAAMSSVFLMLYAIYLKEQCS